MCKDCKQTKKTNDNNTDTNIDYNLKKIEHAQHTDTHTHTRNKNKKLQTKLKLQWTRKRNCKVEKEGMSHTFVI